MSLDLSPSPLTHYYRARADIVRLGKEGGYPKCCIAQFAEEALVGTSPVKLRGARDGYVPCDLCLPEVSKDPHYLTPEQVYA